MRQVAIVTLMFLSSAVHAQESLCTGTEQILFNCQIVRSTKLVSVCGSKELTRDHGYLQYRFGTRKKIELVFPSSKKETQRQFYWSEMRPYQSSVDELSFANGEYLYTISRYDVSEILNDIPGGFQGGDVVVQQKGKQEFKRLKCSDFPSGEFYLGNVVRDRDGIINP